MIPAIGGGYYSLGDDSTEITRLDSNLNFIWQKEINSDRITSLFQCTNGDLLFTGWTNNNVFVIRTDSALNIQWSNQYQNSPNSSLGERIIEHSQSKSIYVLGTAPDYYLTHTKPFALLMKLNSEGNFIWAKLKGDNYTSNGVDLAESTDNQLLMTDMQYSLNGYYANIDKLDTNGINIWNTMAASTGMFGPVGEPDDLCPTYNDGCAAIVQTMNLAHTGSAVLCHVIDGFGNYDDVLYELPDGNGGTWNFFNMLEVQTSDSGFALSGNLDMPGYSYAMIKVNKLLHVQWCKAYRSNPFNGYPSFLEQKQDGGFFIGTNDQQNTLLLKTDAVGSVNCYDTVLTVNETSLGSGTGFFFPSFTISPVFTTVAYPVVVTSSLTSSWDTVCYDLQSALPEKPIDKFSLLSLYPNPTSDFLQIHLKLKSSDESIRIYDVVGNLVLTSENNLTIDVRSLENGLYVVEVSGNEMKVFGKFLKQ